MEKMFTDITYTLIGLFTVAGFFCFVAWLEKHTDDDTILLQCQNANWHKLSENQKTELQEQYKEWKNKKGFVFNFNRKAIALLVKEYGLHNLNNSEL